MPTGPRPAPPAGTARVACGGTILTHKWAIVFWLQLQSSSPTTADLNALCAKIGAGWGSALVPSVSSDCVMNSVQAVWTPTQGTEIVGSDSTAHAGSLGASPVNASSCFVVSHHTGAYYRGGHSRSYIPGPSAATITNGSTLSPSAANGMASSFQAFQAAIEAGVSGAITSVQAGTVRFASKNEWMPTPQFTRWVSHTCRSTIGTQRGRLTE